jgi:hypothetical protein
MGDCLLWAIWAKITEVAHIIGLLFHTAKVMHDFFQKMDWATFWATFSQTHLVTLVSRGWRKKETSQADSSSPPFRSSDTHIQGDRIGRFSPLG